MGLVIIGVFIAAVIITVTVTVKTIFDMGYKRARRDYRSDALKWREHDVSWCADREAHRRFLATMSAASQIEAAHR